MQAIYKNFVFSVLDSKQGLKSIGGALKDNQVTPLGLGAHGG